MAHYAIITKNFRFEAAHQLPYHKGKCARLHGHSYRLAVSVRSKIQDISGQSSYGMVLDFGDLSEIVKQSIIEKLDHQNLNEVTGIYTTAENLAHWMWSALIAAGLPAALLYKISLWETENSVVEITQAEREEQN